MKRDEQWYLLAMKGAVPLLILIFLVGIWHVVKPLPEGIAYASAWEKADVEFLSDVTYMKGGERVSEQEIFDKVFERIDGAKEHIVLDMFLYNPWLGTATESYRVLSGELTDALVQKKLDDPSVTIDVITDPINTVYGGAISEDLEQLRSVGINVVVTDLRPLRDSNPLYSSFYRVFFQWFGNSVGGELPNPFSAYEPGVPLRSYLRLLNFKANHRKVLVVDGDIMVLSANPHDGSSAHENVAVEVSGLGYDAFMAENAVAEMSGGELVSQVHDRVTEGEYDVKLVTESRTRRGILQALRNTGVGDSVTLAMFYLSDRLVVKELIKAKERGAEVTVILDANKDAFGRKKPGIPNRQVARELVAAGIVFRWYSTHGEQFHTKMLVIERSDGTTVVILGSANFTRRNLRDFNLEMDVVVRGESSLPFFVDVQAYIARILENDDGKYSVGYEKFEDNTFWKRAAYRVQEFTGMSSF